MRRRSNSKRLWEKQVSQTCKQTKDQLHRIAFDFRHSGKSNKNGFGSHWDDDNDNDQSIESYTDPYYHHDDETNDTYDNHDTLERDDRDTYDREAYVNDDRTLESNVIGNNWSEANDTFTRTNPWRHAHDTFSQNDRWRHGYDTFAQSVENKSTYDTNDESYYSHDQVTYETSQGKYGRYNVDHVGYEENKKVIDELLSYDKASENRSKSKPTPSLDVDINMDVAIYEERPQSNNSGILAFMPCCNSNTTTSQNVDSSNNGIANLKLQKVRSSLLLLLFCYQTNKS